MRDARYGTGSMTFSAEQMAHLVAVFFHDCVLTCVRAFTLKASIFRFAPRFEVSKVSRHGEGGSSNMEEEKEIEEIYTVNSVGCSTGTSATTHVTDAAAAADRRRTAVCIARAAVFFFYIVSDAPNDGFVSQPL